MRIASRAFQLPFSKQILQPAKHKVLIASCPRSSSRILTRHYSGAMGSVDTTFHAHTTGRAADLVAAHSKEEPLKLWAGWFCPFVQRAWIVLEEKKIPYQYHEVNPYKKEADFLKLNPRGLVPTLECPVGPNGKGRPLFESNVICEYLDEVYNEENKYGQSLLPEDPYLRARCRVWIDFAGSRVVPGFYRWLQHLPEKSYSIEEARTEFFGHLKTFVKEMDPEGPFFLGERFSLVDVCLAPWLIRLFLIDHYKPGGLGMPAEGEGGENENSWKRWRLWAEAVEARKSVQETMSDREMYIHVYQRYAEDTTQSQVSKATRAGRGLP